jgi:asparagine synthase (glutamine-hydrolysing)
MLHSLARRGPDSEGIETWPGAALGHRRLAILDLSEAGRQPMLTEDGQIGLAFNGCIYNFLDLRGELEQRGHRFRSNTDTEVLLYGYREWGIDGLARRLRGMFAFAIWDHPRRTLSLVRDRLGVKPLVYHACGGEIAFASTVGALRTAGFGGEIDPNAVLDVLEYGWVTDEHAIYEGIEKLPPGVILEWSGGRATQRGYWSLPESESGRISFAEAVEETERLLLESVSLRLVSDVPVGALLSGGIDSTLVCWALRELNAKITAFTVRAPDDPSDESTVAARTAKSLGISHEIVDMPEGRPSLHEMIDAYSEPFACSSAHALLLVSKAVKSHATVLLTGDGGDDIFLGYPFFRHAWMAQKLANRLPGFAAPAWRALRSAVPRVGPAKRVRNFLDYATGGLGAFAGVHDGLPYFEGRMIPGERLKGRQLAQRQIAPSPESARRMLRDVFQHHKRLHFTSEFMPKVDGATMHYALEARAPFLDHKMWEFAAALPPEVRLRGGILKAVLREIVRRRVGLDVAFRKKQGFTVPVERWLAERWSGLLDRLRGGTILEREGWIRPGSLNAPLDQAVRNNLVPVQLWRLLVLELWMERNVNGNQERPAKASEKSASYRSTTLSVE